MIFTGSAKFGNVIVSPSWSHSASSLLKRTFVSQPVLQGFIPTSSSRWGGRAKRVECLVLCSTCVYLAFVCWLCWLLKRTIILVLGCFPMVSGFLSPDYFFLGWGEIKKWAALGVPRPYLLDSAGTCRNFLVHLIFTQDSCCFEYILCLMFFLLFVLRLNKATTSKFLFFCG